MLVLGDVSLLFLFIGFSYAYMLVVSSMLDHQPFDQPFIYLLSLLSSHPLYVGKSCMCLMY